MRDGKHNRKLKSSRWLTKLSAPYFKPHLNFYENNADCGTNVLSMITGIKPSTILKSRPKGKDYWSDLAVKRYLRKKGYNLVEITKSRVTQCRNDRETPISDDHVLLIGQEIMYGEGTWALIQQGMYYHNFESQILKPLEFINHPTMTVYIVTHPRWEY